MRKHDIVKTIQLIIFILLTAFGCYKIFTNHSLYHMIASDPDVRIMFALLWFVLGLSFFFIFLDFSFSASYKKDYRELDFAVHSDPVAGIANRYSCDALIEKYLDRPLPDTLGCIRSASASVLTCRKRTPNTRRSSATMKPLRLPRRLTLTTTRKIRPSALMRKNTSYGRC